MTKASIKKIFVMIAKLMIFQLACIQVLLFTIYVAGGVNNVVVWSSVTCIIQLIIILGMYKYISNIMDSIFEYEKVIALANTTNTSIEKHNDKD